MKKQLILLVVVFLGAFFRFFKLTDFPIQLNHDEISQLYDVISITKTGKDVYGNFLPLAFPSTGDYKVGHYIYLTTIFYQLFGNNEITIRIPAAFFGSLTVLAVFLFTKKLTKNWMLSLISALMIALTPSEIFYSRKSFENVIGVSLDFLGLYCLLNSLSSRRCKLWGFLGVFLLALAMYVYTSQTIIVPLLLVIFALAYRILIKHKVKNYLYFFVAFVIFIIPLFAVTIMDYGLRYRAKTVFISQDPILGRQLEIVGNSFKTYSDYIFSRFLNQFNPEYIFANGLNLTNQGLIGLGPLLLYQLPFFILGVIDLIREKTMVKVSKMLFGMAVVAMIPSAVTFEPYSPHRAMLSFSALSIISGFGIYCFFKKIKEIHLNYRLKILIFSLTFFMLILNLIYFIWIYTISYPNEKSQQIHYPFKKVALFAWSQYNNFGQIIIDPTYGEVAPAFGVATHYYLAYYGKYPPAKLQNDLKIKSDGMVLDKFYIRKINWAKDQILKDTLIIASPWSIPIDTIEKNKIIKEFDFYDGQPAFYAIKL